MKESIKILLDVRMSIYTFFEFRFLDPTSQTLFQWANANGFVYFDLFNPDNPGFQIFVFKAPVFPTFELLKRCSLNKNTKRQRD